MRRVTRLDEPREKLSAAPKKLVKRGRPPQRKKKKAGISTEKERHGARGPS